MPNSPMIVNEETLRNAVPLDIKSIAVVKRAFCDLAAGKVIMPPILSMSLEARNADVDVKTAYVDGMEAFAVKISPGFFDNPGLGLPSTSGLMVLFSATTGQVRAVLLDNGYLTDVRTAAAGAVAAKYLARDTVDCAGVIGTGVQAGLQVEAAHIVKPFQRAFVWGRDFDKAARLASDLTQKLAVPVTATRDRAALVRDSQLVITATPSRAPLIETDWLHPGLHITAMGSDTPGKSELAPGVLAAADLYVADHLAQCAELGELAAAIRAGSMTAGPHPELGQIAAGDETGRRSDADVTIADLTGTGAQDTAIADFAYQKVVSGVRA